MWLFILIPLLVLTTPAFAKDGFYIGLDAGVTAASDLTIATTGDDDWVANDYPSIRCDRTINPDGVQTSPGDCQDDPQTWGPLTDPFSGGMGILTGVTAGYRWQSFRLEAEYFYRTIQYDSQVIPSSATYDPRTEVQLAKAQDTLDDLDSHNGFLNLYYDYRTDSKWTPYLGIGVGIGQIAMDYQTIWRRSANPDDIAIFDASTPEGLALNQTIAGTVSADRERLTDTVMGYQLLAGVDYQLTAPLSIGVKLRWTNMGEFYARSEYDTLRGHASVAGNPPRPVTYDIKTRDADFFGLTLNMKYAF